LSAIGVDKIIERTLRFDLDATIARLKHEAGHIATWHLSF